MLLALPLNVVVNMPSQLEEPSERIWKDFTDYLAAHDRKVRTTRLVDARPLWAESARKAHDEIPDSTFEDALRLLAQRLAQETDFDALVMPSVVTKLARRWDHRFERDLRDCLSRRTR